jgi:glycosyltransferase involved in cell wall biosynthesis
LRIGIDYTAAVRQGAGIGRYTRELVRALAELDRDNDYVLFAAAGGQRLADKGWPSNFQMRSVPLSDRALAILWYRLQLPLWVELVTGPVDIFHSPDFVLPPVRRARPEHGRRTKTLVTVHDLSFIRYPQCADANLRAYLNKVVPRSVHRADLVLADSQNTKDDLVELMDLEHNRIEVIYPGIEERFRSIEDQALLEEVRKRYNLPPRFILGLGTLQPRKNFTHLIQAYSLLVTRYPLLHLVIAGGKGWLYEEIFATVEQLDLAEKVVFPGFVADQDLPALYNLADLFVFPSLYEGFGLPPLEALACGTPVVTSNASSLPEVVGEAGLMVGATDVEALAETMKRVLEDNALREGMIAKGVEQARKFTWQKAAAKLLNLYETLNKPMTNDQ